MKNHATIILKKYLSNEKGFKKLFLDQIINVKNDEDISKDFFLNIPFMFEPKIIFAEELIEAGADRIGTSKGVELMVLAK